MAELVPSGLSPLDNDCRSPQSDVDSEDEQCGVAGEEEPWPSDSVLTRRSTEFEVWACPRGSGFSGPPSLTALMSAAEKEVAKSVHVTLSISSTAEWMILYRQLRQCLCIGQVMRVDFSDVSLDNNQWTWLCQSMMPAMLNLTSLRLVRMGMTDRKLAELLRHCLTNTVSRRCQSDVGQRGLLPTSGPRPLFRETTLFSSNEADFRRDDGYSPLRGLCTLDLSENNLTHHSATLIGKLLLWSADTLDELRLMGNPLQDYGFQVLSIYISRLQLSSLRGEPHLFPPELVRSYAKHAEGGQVSDSQCHEREGVQSPVSHTPFLGACNTSNSGVNAVTGCGESGAPFVHLGISLLDVRDCRASVRGISELLVAASAAHRLSTILLAGNAATTSSLSRPKMVGVQGDASNTNGGVLNADGAVTTSTAAGAIGGGGASSGCVRRSGAFRVSSFSELRHPCALSTIDLSGVALSTLCTPLGCRDLFLNLFFCCPQLSLLDLSGTFSAAQLSLTAVRDIHASNRQVFADDGLPRESYRRQVQKLVETSSFGIDKLVFDQQVCVGNILCELVAHAALNAQRRRSAAPTAFRRLRELNLEGTGLTDAAAKGLSTAVRTVALSGVFGSLVSLNVAGNFLSSQGCVCLLRAFITEWPLACSPLEVVSLERSRGIVPSDVSALDEVRQAAVAAVERRKKDQKKGSRMPSLLVEFGAVGTVVQSISSNDELTADALHVGNGQVSSSTACEGLPESIAPFSCKSQGASIGVIIPSQDDDGHQKRLQTEKLLSETLFYAHQLETVANAGSGAGDGGECALGGGSHQPTYQRLESDPLDCREELARASSLRSVEPGASSDKPQPDDSGLYGRSCSSQVTVLPSSLGIEFGHLLGPREVTHDPHGACPTNESLDAANDEQEIGSTTRWKERSGSESGGIIRVSSQLIYEEGHVPPDDRLGTCLESRSDKGADEPHRKKEQRRSALQQRSGEQLFTGGEPKLRRTKKVILSFYHEAGDKICRGWTLLQRGDSVGERARGCLGRDFLACLQPPEGRSGRAAVESVTLLLDVLPSPPRISKKRNGSDSYSGKVWGPTIRLLVVSNESRTMLEERLRDYLNRTDESCAFPYFTKVMRVFGVDMVKVTHAVLGAIPNRCREAMGAVTAESFVHRRHGREDRLLGELYDLLVDAVGPACGERGKSVSRVASKHGKRLSLETGEPTESEDSVQCSNVGAPFSQEKAETTGEVCKRGVKGYKRIDSDNESSQSPRDPLEPQSNTTSRGTSPEQPNEGRGKVMLEEAGGRSGKPRPHAIVLSLGNMSPRVPRNKTSDPPRGYVPSPRPDRIKAHIFPLLHREGGVLCCGWRLLHRTDKAGEIARHELEGDVMSFLNEVVAGTGGFGLSDMDGRVGSKSPLRANGSSSVVKSVRISFDESSFSIRVCVTSNLQRAVVSDRLAQQQEKEGEAAFPRFTRMMNGKGTYNTVVSVETHLQQRDSSGEVRKRILGKYRTISALVHRFHGNDAGLLKELKLSDLKDLDVFAEAVSSPNDAKEPKKKVSREAKKATESDNVPLTSAEITERERRPRKDRKGSEDVASGESVRSLWKSQNEFVNHVLTVDPSKAAALPVHGVPTGASPSSISSLTSSGSVRCDRVPPLPEPEDSVPGVAQVMSDVDDESIVTNMDSVFAEKLRRLQYLSYNAIAHGALLLDRKQRHKKRICKGKWGRVCVTVAVEWDVFLVVYFVKHSAFRVSSRKSLVLVHPIASGVRCSVEVGGATTGGTSAGGNDVVVNVERVHSPEDLGLATGELEQQLEQVISSVVRKKEGAPSMCSNRDSLTNTAHGGSSVVSRYSSTSALGSVEQGNGSMFLTLIPTASQLLHRQVTMRVTLKTAAKARRVVSAIHEAGERAVCMIRETIMEQRRQAAAAAAVSS